MARATYADLLLDEWRMSEQSRRIQASVRKVLKELAPESCLLLRDPRLEVMVTGEASFSVWAYFPIHRRRRVAHNLKPKDQTRVLLVFSAADCEKQSAKLLEDQLRDHLGHVLLYLRDPRARNECVDAQKEWRASNARSKRATTKPRSKAALDAKLAPKGE